MNVLQVTMNQRISLRTNLASPNLTVMTDQKLPFGPIPQLRCDERNPAALRVDPGHFLVFHDGLSAEFIKGHSEVKPTPEFLRFPFC